MAFGVENRSRLLDYRFARWRSNGLEATFDSGWNFRSCVPVSPLHAVCYGRTTQAINAGRIAIQLDELVLPA
jgi:hypothetical protein